MARGKPTYEYSHAELWLFVVDFESFSLISELQRIGCWKKEIELLTIIAECVCRGLVMLYLLFLLADLLKRKEIKWNR